MADDPARHFADMAARIAKIDMAEFAGAVVIVPPDGEPVAFLTTETPAADIVQFWATAKTRVEIRLASAMDQASGANPWQGRR
jgi:hypothetical protein